MLTHPSKQVLAALRLAGVYGAGVAVLLLAYLAMGASLHDLMGMLPYLSIPAAICFAVAFLVLGVARRTGFVILWLLVFGIWLWQALGGTSHNWRFSHINLDFIAWSILAAPLYTMVAIGFPPTGTRRAWISWAVAAAWAALAVAADRIGSPFFFYGPPSALTILLRILWLAAPTVLTLTAIYRIRESPTPASPVA